MLIYDGKQYREATPEEEAKYNIPAPEENPATSEEILNILLGGDAE